MRWCYCAAVLTFCCLQKVFSQVCTPASGLTRYDLSSQPTSDPFTNSSTLGPGCFPLPSQNIWECFTSGTLPVLVDGQLGQVQSPPSASTIHAWSRFQQTTFSVALLYPTATQVRHIHLYFYHVPSMGIGLPEIALSAAGISKNYFVTGNQNLNSTDAERRMVILSFEDTLVSENRFMIEFTFGTSTKIDWLLLSEVQMCTQPTTVLAPSGTPELVPIVPLVRSADNVSPNLTLSCTVSGEGRFSWIWTGPQSPVRVWSSDFTRTSTAEFTGIRGLTSGGTTYRCTATYDPDPGLMSVSRNFEVTLEFAITGDTTNVMVSIGSTVSLSCEGSGYLPSAIPDITWFRLNNIELGNGSVYTITSRDGSRSIQNGGPSPVPSVIGVLSFVVNTSMQNEPFHCQFQGRVVLFFVTTSSPTSEIDETETVPVTQMMVTSSSMSFSVVVIIVVVVSIFVLLIIAFVTFIFIILACLKCKSKDHSSPASDVVYEVPSDIDTVNMNRSVAYGVITGSQEPFAVTSCSAYEL